MASARVFRDRQEAGRLLGATVAEVLAVRASSSPSPPVIVGLARGGVPVARAVADALGADRPADLDVIVVRKIGAPGHREFAMGALTAGHLVVNDDVPRRLGVGPTEFDAIAERERRILVDRESRYRRGRSPVDVDARLVVLVDDGIATGSTMAVAIEAVRAGGAATVIVAVPTGPADIVAPLRERGADEVVILRTPEPFRAVGLSYADFTQVDDDAVIAALTRRGR